MDRELARFRKYVDTNTHSARLAACSVHLQRVLLQVCMQSPMATAARPEHSFYGAVTSQWLAAESRRMMVLQAAQPTGLDTG